MMDLRFTITECSWSYLPHDGLAAGPTHPLGHRLYAQLVEVRLQASQHVVQFVHLSGGRATAFPLSTDLFEEEQP